MVLGMFFTQFHDTDLQKIRCKGFRVPPNCLQFVLLNGQYVAREEGELGNKIASQITTGERGKKAVERDAGSPREPELVAAARIAPKNAIYLSDGGGHSATCRQHKTPPAHKAPRLWGRNVKIKSLSALWAGGL